MGPVRRRVIGMSFQFDDGRVGGGGGQCRRQLEDEARRHYEDYPAVEPKHHAMMAS